jgi:hypothetical protein
MLYGVSFEILRISEVVFPEHGKQFYNESLKQACQNQKVPLTVKIL